MVINYKKYPLLKMFEKSNDYLHSLAFFEEDILEQKEECIKFVNLWKDLYPKLKVGLTNTIFIASIPFLKAMERSNNAFLKLDTSKFVKELKHPYGIFLNAYNNFGVIYMAIDDVILYLIFQGQTLIANVSVCYADIGKPNYNVYGIRFLTKNTSCIPDTHKTWKQFALSETNVCLLFLKFKEYAKIEIEEGKCGKMFHSKILREKLRNNLPFDVKIMDSTWFTTICRNEGFNVRGHFRLQPKKNENGEWIKELIYINEFQKYGYHRQAKILKQ